jgi:hypothetical protein
VWASFIAVFAKELLYLRRDLHGNERETDIPRFSCHVEQPRSMLSHRRPAIVVAVE